VSLPVDLILAQAPAPAPAPDVVSTGEAIVFWVLGPIALLGALGMVFARNAVHSALALVATMFSLAIFYLVQQAPFLGFVQIIVYTGAIMMLFLFVLMLVGRDSSDSVVEVLRGQRLAALVLGVGLAVLLVGALGSGLTSVQPVGLAANDAGSGGNVTGLGRLVFTDYLFAFELTSALLITAALGAMVLAFTGRNAKGGKPSQRELVKMRFRGEHDRPSPLPGPGVFATASSVSVPALLPDGSIAPESISAIIDATPVEENPPPAVDAHALTDGRSPTHGEASRIDTPDQQHADARAMAGGGLHGHEESES
jgi:NADH-quinone oxidoreductase subunit J